MSLNNLSVGLVEVGRWDEGLVAIEEATEIYRGVAEAKPAAYLPNLAMSLNTLSRRLGEAGRRDEGLGAWVGNGKGLGGGGGGVMVVRCSRDR